MAGGKGTRLWPVSRISMPKQFCKLNNEPSLFQSTLERICRDEMFNDPVIVTSANYLSTVKLQMKEIGFTAKRIICEPCARDTAAAIALCCADPVLMADEYLIVMPADHKIEAANRFNIAVEEAASIAKTTNSILTFGITPTEPATGYGYLMAGEQIANTSAKSLAGFIEKPDFEKAQFLIENEPVYWNAGIFLFKPDVMTAEFEKHAPAIFNHAKMALEEGENAGEVMFVDEQHFSKINGISIDYAIMEKTDNAALLPVDPQWSDVGCWDAVWAASSQDDKANAISGNSTIHNVQNSYVYSDGPTIALSHVEDLIVVANQDAVLVTSRGNSQSVKELLKNVEDHKPELTKQHIDETRPWGKFASIHKGDQHQAKTIVVNPGGQLSLQYHFHRAEHWVVVRGIATVTVGEEVMQLSPCQHVFIPQGALHRLENLTDEDVEIIEVQYGSYLGEDDIVRVEDVYDRPETEVAINPRKIA